MNFTNFFHKPGYIFLSVILVINMNTPGIYAQADSAEQEVPFAWGDFTWVQGNNRQT